MLAHLLRVSLLAAIAIATADADADTDAAPARTALAAPFAAMEKALRASDEPAFRAHWHPDGYARNLVGGSGSTGASIFGQGARKHWFLKPDLAAASMRGEGGLAIVPCKVWSWDKNAAVDAADVVIVKVKDAYVVLGAGEKRAQVDALAQRWLDGKPLDPR